MKRKLLKFTYVVDGIVLIISYIYFFMYYLSAALQSADSAKLISFQNKLQTIVEFGVYYETAVWFAVLFFFAILITAIFSAVFYNQITSDITFKLLIFSPAPIFLPYPLLFISYLFVRDDISMATTASGVCFTISAVALLVYAVFMIRLMCKDYKKFSKQTN